MDTHEAADVAVASEHQRMTVGEHHGEAVGHAFAEGVEALERRRAAPGHEHRHRRLALAEVEALEHRLDRLGHGRGVDLIAVEREAGAITGTLRNGRASSGET